MGDHLIPTADLQRWSADLWRAAGSSEREAALTAEHLVGANLAGHDSHGVGMIPRYVDAFLAGELQLNQAVTIVSDAGTLLTIDGKHGMGSSVAFQAMEIAIDRARTHGVCVMGLRNAHHIARVGRWAEQAMASGFASVHFTNALAAGPMVAPYGGAKARFLTNPLTVGIPRRGADPILLDFATSAIAYGKARVAYNRKEKVPTGCLIDAQGRATDDPAVMFEEPHGALVAFAAHKGYALAMVCELLGAALIGGPTARPENMRVKHAIWNNMLTIVFDPARLGAGDAFEREARAFVEWVQSAPLSGVIDRILVPGDPERRSRKARAEAVPIDGETLAQLDGAAAAIGRAKGRSPGPLSALEHRGNTRSDRPASS
jgi:uncharacterized oxidoreductase